MTARKALLMVLFWGVTFASVGGVIGATLGTVAPDYYRSVFRDGHAANFNPFQVGIGLGVTQGLACGVAMALGVLALLAWRDHRSEYGGSISHSADEVRGPRRWSRTAFWGVATALSVVILSSVAFVLGGIIGQHQLYQLWTDRKLDKIAIVLESHEFPDVTANYSSAAQVYLVGTVKDDAARQSLHDKLVLAFGSEEADEMTWRVDVRP